MRGLVPPEGARADQSLRRARRRVGIIGQEPCDRVRDGGRVLRIDQRAGVADHLGQRPAVRGDNRHAERHRLEHGDAEAFVERRLDQEARAFVERAAISRIDVTDMAHHPLQRRPRETLEPRARLVGRFPREDELRNARLKASRSTEQAQDDRVNRNVKLVTIV